MHDDPTIGNDETADAAFVPAGGPEQPTMQMPEYELLECIGEGGFGVVYRARQTEPYRKEVAIKFIKKGRDTAVVLARFRQEQQALARMSHEGIAKIYDAGQTEDGRPYFVMEFVRGEPITAYCDRHRLAIMERVDLFARVCDAVHHAHTKGFIHRDLSPSNVLVQEIDGHAMPKIIDFGVAKALEGEADPGVITIEGQPIGKYDYMSPEQAEMGRAGLDTRSDVYSLGVMLYELLTGALPLDVRNAVREEIPKLIRELEPARPSTRLTAIGDTAKTVASSRQTSISGLRSRLRSELEWIPMRALRKRPPDRYDSAAELAKDLRNYLKGERLIAGPDSLGYILRTTIRRHRTPFILTGTAAACLAIGLTLAAVGFARAARNAKLAASTRTVLVDLIYDGAEAGGPDATLRDLLYTSLNSPVVESAEPAVRASLRAALVRGLLRLGALSGADEAWNSLTDDEGWENELSDTELWQVRVSRVSERYRAGEFDEANRLLDQAAEQVGDNPAMARTVLLWRGNIAKKHAKSLPSHQSAEKNQLFTKAIEAYTEVAEETDRARSPGSEDAWTARYNTALVLREQKEYANAADAMQTLLTSISDQWDSTDTKRLQASSQLASLLYILATQDESVGRNELLDDSIALFEKVHREQRTVQSREHWRRIETNINLALAYEKRILRGGATLDSDRARLAELLPIFVWGERSGGYLDIRGFDDGDTLQALKLYLRMMGSLDQSKEAEVALLRIANEAEAVGKHDAAAVIRQLLPQ